jgi:hypothetical protein
MPDSKAAAIVSEALALHASHPHAPAIGVADQVIFERRTWLEDFSVHVEPRAPFALLAAELVGRYGWTPPQFNTCPRAGRPV